MLDLLRQELSTAAIARRLVLSPVTVRSHINNILRKVRAPSREALLKDFEGAIDRRSALRRATER